MNRKPLLGALLVVVLAPPMLAQATDTSRPAPTPQAAATPTIGPPIRRISTASAVSKEKIGSVNAVRELPDGRVLVNDATSRRLLLMDTMLVTERVVLDSTSETANTYGTRQGALIAHHADSSIFIDPSSLALLVIDPSGNITRVRSVPRAQDTYSYGNNSGSMGMPATDAAGRLVYRIWAEPARPLRPPPRGVPYIPQQPDSAFIVALDIDTRKLDTLGAIRIPRVEYVIRRNAQGGINVWNAQNPLPSQDEWSVLPDGAIAFVRGVDYRIDFRNPDGSWTSSPKIPFDWQPMSDAEKERLVDSLRTSQSRNFRTTYVTQVIRYVNTYGKKYPPNFSAPEGYVPPNGFAKDWNFPPGVNFPERYIYACPRGVEPTITQQPAAASPSDRAAGVKEQLPAAAAAPDGPSFPGVPAGGRPSCIPQPIPDLARVPQPPTLREVFVMSPNQLPDFRPPFAQNAVRADLDGNLWIRTAPARPAPLGSGPVYDVVNRGGQLVDRLQLPPGYSLVGFGRGKVVFLSMRDAGGVHLARARLK